MIAFTKPNMVWKNVSGRTTPAFRKEFPKLNESTVRGLMKNMSKNENARKRLIILRVLVSQLESKDTEL